MSSILNDTKKLVGIANNDTTFDLDIISYINEAFATLDDVGVGPNGGFLIEDKSDEWDDFLEGDDVSLNRVKIYIAGKVRLQHDLPSTSFGIEALERSISEALWRLQQRSDWRKDPVDPNPREEDTDDD